MSKSDHCIHCGSFLERLRISDFGGMSCEKCYYQRHPFYPHAEFQSMLAAADDQLLIRQLLNEHVPPDVKNQVRDQYNKIRSERYGMRCRELGFEPPESSEVAR